MSGPRFGFFDNDVGATFTVEAQQWVHLTFVYDGVSVKSIYVNGHLRDSSPGASYIGKTKTARVCC